MFIGYESSTRQYKRSVPAPYVSINNRAEIVMNLEALRLIYTFDGICLHYDAESNRLGIARAGLDNRELHVFHARRYGRYGRLRVFRARRFFNKFGIKINETLRFRDVTVDENGMLILDLATPGSALTDP
jgi:hypothetical protein